MIAVLHYLLLLLLCVCVGQHWLDWSVYSAQDVLTMVRVSVCVCVCVCA